MSLPASRSTSVRRFPTLDSWGSALDGAGSGGVPAAGPNSKPCGPVRTDSLAALAAQHFTHVFAAPAAEPAPMAAPPVPLGRGPRKRQHSSRRTLMATLSRDLTRDNSVASSLDGLQPLMKNQHLMPEGGSCGASPDRSGWGMRAEPSVPGVPPRQLHRSGSTLGREAANAATAIALAAAAALAAGLPADASPPATTPTKQSFPGFAGSDCACGGSSACRQAVQRSSPLHARMTCMKLRDSD